MLQFLEQPEKPFSYNRRYRLLVISQNRDSTIPLHFSFRTHDARPPVRCNCPALSILTRRCATPYITQLAGHSAKNRSRPGRTVGPDPAIRRSRLRPRLRNRRATGLYEWPVVPVPIFFGWEFLVRRRDGPLHNGIYRFGAALWLPVLYRTFAQDRKIWPILVELRPVHAQTWSIVLFSKIATYLLTALNFRRETVDGASEMRTKRPLFFITTTIPRYSTLVICF